MSGRLLLLLLTAASAAALFVVGSQASTGWKTERFYSRETFHSFADNGKKEGGGPTDVYVSQQTLSDASGKRVGLVNGYGVNLRAPYVFFHFTGAIGRSTITLEGAVSLAGKADTYAIVGGTGRFEGAQGTVTTSDAGDKGSLVVVRYRL